jgi:hypothetical protein
LAELLMGLDLREASSWRTSLTSPFLIFMPLRIFSILQACQSSK